MYPADLLTRIGCKNRLFFSVPQSSLLPWVEKKRRSSMLPRHLVRGTGALKRVFEVSTRMQRRPTNRKMHHLVWFLKPLGIPLCICTPPKTSWTIRSTATKKFAHHRSVFSAKSDVANASRYCLTYTKIRSYNVHTFSRRRCAPWG